MLRPWILSTIALLVAASSAFAGTTNLSGTVTTNVPALFADDFSTAGSNVTGASDNQVIRVFNTTPNSGGTWTVSAGIGTTGIAPLIALTFYVRSPNASNVTALLNRVQFTDSSGNTATLSGIGFSLTLTANNVLTAFTHNSSLLSYTTAGSFVAANVNAITFDIVFVTNGGNNKVYALDAVDITTATPEPATVGLFALGALGLGCLVRRRARDRAARKPSARSA